MPDQSRTSAVAAAIADIDTTCRHFADRLDELRVTDTVRRALVFPAGRFARLPSEQPGQAGNWAYPSGSTSRSLTATEVNTAVDRAQHQLRGTAALLPGWRTETEADLRSGKSSGDTSTPLEALARADARMDQIRNGISILRSPFPGLYLPIDDDSYTDAEWADDYDNLSPAAVHLGTALLRLAMGSPGGALAEITKVRTRLA
ncbi:hypothetical protein ACIRST_40585 [Kitasatospora sp. NPDC101447]|uniref:hypothetical protein n=1 Tax=Kitasatospora sp. NPDC101447 TaxID=3364102 RepID=UPI0037FCED5E